MQEFDCKYKGLFNHYTTVIGHSELLTNHWKEYYKLKQVNKCQLHKLNQSKSKFPKAETQIQLGITMRTKMESNAPWQSDKNMHTGKKNGMKNQLCFEKWYPTDSIKH